MISAVGRLGPVASLRMSAPAMKLEPAQCNTTACTDASLPSSSAASAMPSRTDGAIALTGGLSTTIRPMAPWRSVCTVSVCLVTVKAWRGRHVQRKAPSPRSTCSVDNRPLCLQAHDLRIDDAGLPVVRKRATFDPFSKWAHASAQSAAWTLPQMHPANTKRPRMLIMGGTGTVGSHLLRELLPDRERFEIVAAARSAASAARLRAAGYETVTLDLERNETLEPALRGVHTLFMLKPYSMDYLIQSKRVIDAAVRAGVRHVVNLGSFGADDTPWASIGWNRLVEAYSARLRAWPDDAAPELLHGQRTRAH